IKFAEIRSLRLCRGTEGRFESVRRLRFCLQCLRSGCLITAGILYRRDMPRARLKRGQPPPPDPIGRSAPAEAGIPERADPPIINDCIIMSAPSTQMGFCG